MNIKLILVLKIVAEDKMVSRNLRHPVGGGKKPTFEELGITLG